MNDKTQKISTILFVVIFCVFISHVVHSKTHTPAAQHTSPTLDNHFSGTAKVIDGDSIIVDGKEVRLIGIDAPEYSQTCFDKHDQLYDCGKMAQQFLLKLADHKNVTCYYNQKDIYERYLAQCTIADISINHTILENGHAVIYDYRQASQTLKKIEQQARIKKRGIWQGKFQLPKAYRKRRK